MQIDCSDSSLRGPSYIYEMDIIIFFIDKYKNIYLYKQIFCKWPLLFGLSTVYKRIRGLEAHKRRPTL